MRIVARLTKRGVVLEMLEGEDLRLEMILSDDQAIELGDTLCRMVANRAGPEDLRLDDVRVDPGEESDSGGVAHELRSSLPYPIEHVADEWTPHGQLCGRCGVLLLAGASRATPGSAIFEIDGRIYSDRPAAPVRECQVIGS